ncbi:MAG: protein-L-isoaspartate(D-aspartate) O-methyltransferase [Cryomorphaceae bacterium]|nr:protein-L-isoaspartate(D-aspartate) O-methyltransferase [Cryomorphaceae bacterium]
MTPDLPRHQGQRQQLVALLRSKGIDNERVLAAMARIPRHAFLESSFEEFAYQDVAFPIAAGQTISQPYTVAVQSSALGLPEGAKILEIGTGSGYQAAVLEELGYKVFTIERQKALFDFSKRLLSELGMRRITQKFGDGYKGLPAFAPFDGILITAAAPELPSELLEQLAPGGVLVVPVGDVESEQRMLRVRRGSDGTWDHEDLGSFRFVPMLKDVATAR